MPATSDTAGSLDAVLGPVARAFDLDRLTTAERRVLALAVVGLTLGEMTERLQLPEAAVREHLGRVYGKLGVGGRVDLLARVAREAAGDDPAPERDEDDPDLTPPSELPFVLALGVGVAVAVLLCLLLPPAAILIGPALVLAGWRIRRTRGATPAGIAALWVLLVGVVLCFLVLAFLLLLLFDIAVTPVAQ